MISLMGLVGIEYGLPMDATIFYIVWVGTLARN